MTCNSQRTMIPGHALLTGLICGILCGGCDSSLRTSRPGQHAADTAQGLATENAALSIAEPYRVLITGHDYHWHVRHPGPDGELETSDDILAERHLHLPRDTEVILTLRSSDYLYTLSLPEYGLKEIAVPDLEFELRLTPDRSGRFELRGDQMCGYSHPQLLGRLVVQSPSEFATWLDTQQDSPGTGTR